jgi:nitrite reductase/ring-hydroxylating ferredoxin subunit
MSSRMDDATTPHLDRRRLLGCTALLGLTGPLLVACGSDEPADGGADAGSGTSGDGSASPDASSPAGAGGGLVAADEVPVGGGVVITGQQLIVTQPVEGEFKGYTTVCTHQGGDVTSVSDGRMTCSLHGSQFAIKDGANVVGPNGSEAGSVAPLPEIPVRVRGGQVVKA